MNTFEKKLADMIHEHPNLYDQSRRDYKDNLKAHLSWKEIADSMGKSEEAVKLKWKNLRDKFCKAKKRMAKRSFLPLTDDENPVERPVPVLYNQLAWLTAYVKPRVVAGIGDTDEVCSPGRHYAFKMYLHPYFNEHLLATVHFGPWKCSRC